MPCNPLTIVPTDPTESLPFEHSRTQIPQQCIFWAYRSAVYLFSGKNSNRLSSFILLTSQCYSWMRCTAADYYSEWTFHRNFHSNESTFSSEHGLRCPQAFRNTLYLLRQKDLKEHLHDGVFQCPDNKNGIWKIFCLFRVEIVQKTVMPKSPSGILLVVFPKILVCNPLFLTAAQASIWNESEMQLSIPQVTYIHSTSRYRKPSL